MTDAEHVGFIRSIMHGRDGVTAAWLVAEARAAGATEASTYHATGNLLFAADDPRAVCDHVTAVVSARVGRDTTVVHRTGAEVRRLAAEASFTGAPDDAERLCVLSTVPIDASALRAVLPDGVVLMSVRDDRDVVCWRGSTDAPHPHPIVEALTGAPATARSISTITGVAARLGGGRHRRGPTPGAA